MKLSKAQWSALYALDSSALDPVGALIHIGPQWRSTVTSLEERGLVTYHNSRIRITKDGIAALDAKEA